MTFLTIFAALAFALGGDKAPVLVELFTSEGCSSCPPADRWLQQLDSSQPIAGAQLIVLSEHVDYWDQDGWKDPFSSHLATERQLGYARQFHLSQPYTPQLVVDGSTEIEGNDPARAQQIFQKAATEPKVPIRIVSVSVDGSTPPVLRARIEADASAEMAGADIYLALALKRAESQVLRGENGGHKLTHVAVVEELTKIGRLSKGKGFHQDVQRKLKPGTDPSNVRIVAFVQETGPGKILGAAEKSAPFQ